MLATARTIVGRSGQLGGSLPLFGMRQSEQANQRVDPKIDSANLDE